MSETAHILSLLTSDKADAIREGAHLAGTARLEETIPALVKHITSTNIGVLEAVDRALRKIGGPTVVHAVIPLLRSDEAPARNISMDILRTLGSSDLAALVELLHDDDPDIRIFASDILGSVGTAQAVAPLCHALLHDPEVNVRYQAAVSLGVLANPEAAPCLNKALKDEEWVQFSVIQALTELREESSISAMSKALDTSSDLVASTIVDALGEMGNIKAIPLLLKRLNSSPTPLCNKIVRAIINILGERSLALLGEKECMRLRGYMQAALEDEDTEVQDAAIKGFAALGGESATVNILKIAGKINPETNHERMLGTVEALVKAGYNSVLEDAIRKGDDATMLVALEAVTRMEHPDILPLLMEVFWEEQRDTQRIIILELSNRAGTEHQQFFLDILARHSDGDILRSALFFLGNKGNPVEIQDSVIEMLTHEFDDVKESALEACIMLRTPQIEEHIKNMLKHHEPTQRLMGAYALGFFGSESNSDILSDALRDESADVRRVAIEALGRDCPISLKRSALIEERLADDNREVRMAVVEALGNCGEKRLDVCLIKGLNDVDPWVRARCAEKLGGRQSHEAVERLVYMLGETNNLVVIKTIEALGMIGGESAFRALLALFDSPDPDIAQAAAEAVDSIRRKAGE